MTDDGKIARHPARPGVLSLTIRERNALYAAYMPYIKGGGLFIPTNRTYQMGDQVYMLLSLMDEPSKYSLSGKVVWITPAGAQVTGSRGSVCSSKTATAAVRYATRSSPSSATR